MFINFWYAAEFSNRLTTEPLKVRLLSHDFVLFRDAEGRAHCLSDTCVHRGGSLSGGKLKQNCVQCPYHGWRFDSDGRCQAIPSLGPDHKVPPRARVDAYPTDERYGLIFVFLGDLPAEERPPLMTVDEWDTDGWRSTTLDYYWQANYQRIIENGLDPAHNEFVHPTHGMSGEDPDYRVNELHMNQEPWGWSFMHTYRGTSTKSFLTRFNEKKRVPPKAGTGHHGPNQMVTKIHINDTKWLHQYIYESPIDEFHTRGFLINMRNFVLPKALDKAVSKRNMIVAEQDRVVVERLAPARTPRRGPTELLMQADRIVALYRERMLEWEYRGWRLDVDAMNHTRAEGGVVTVIPSPARREGGGWVLDPAPLLPQQLDKLGANTTDVA